MRAKRRVSPSSATSISSNLRGPASPKTNWRWSCAGIQNRSARKTISFCFAPVRTTKQSRRRTAAVCKPATRSSAKSRRAIAASSRKSAAPSCSARPLPCCAKNTNSSSTSMNAGFTAAMPGATMADICRAMNAVLEAEGYGEFCHPPHIRRRGHGLGFGSIGPGRRRSRQRDGARARHAVHDPSEPILPETGYLLCGEPAILTPQGAQALTRQHATLAEIAL